MSASDEKEYMKDKATLRYNLMMELLNDVNPIRPYTPIPDEFLEAVKEYESDRINSWGSSNIFNKGLDKNWKDFNLKQDDMKNLEDIVAEPRSLSFNANENGYRQDLRRVSAAEEISYRSLQRD